MKMNMNKLTKELFKEWVIIVRIRGCGVVYNNNNSSLRLYYKNQLELSYALKKYIDAYFENKVSDKELHEKLNLVVGLNKDKFYSAGNVAKKPKQILGKARLTVLEQVLEIDNDSKNKQDS